MEEAIERQLYKDIKTDCYYSVIDILDGYFDYSDKNLALKFLLFSARYSTTRIFKLFYNKFGDALMSEKIVVLNELILGDNFENLTFLAKEYKDKLDNPFFINNALCYIFKNNKPNLLSKYITFLNEENYLEDVISFLKVKEYDESEELINIIKMNNKLKNF